MNPLQRILVAAVVGVLSLLLIGTLIYNQFRVNVTAGQLAVLTKKTGKNIENGDAVAPSAEYKGVQLTVLTEGRHYYNPYTWDWSVYPMVEIPEGRMGVRVRLYGENLPYGDFLAVKDTQKGIVPEVLRPGRYPINAVIKGQEDKRPKGDYVEIIELYDPVSVPPGYRGVVTNLSGPIPEKPNTVLVDAGFRGVQKLALEAGTYFLNPYSQRVHIIDCRSQRFNLAEQGYEMGFPSKDGFWISLDGIIEFRITPEKVAEVFVLYNEDEKDENAAASGHVNIHEELVKKIIMPNARSFCRITGSDKAGKDFIGGETRTDFQKSFHGAMKKTCDPEGVEIVHALVTRINPPQAIAKPIRDREVARQQQLQYGEQKKQQEQEAKLATEKALVKQGTEIVAANQKVIQDVTKAKQEQQVAVTKSEEKKVVAEQHLQAAKDQAAANLAKKTAEAGVIEFQNAADAAGWKKAVESLGDGEAYARYVLYQKLAPAFKSLTANTADSPLMKVFDGFNKEDLAQPPTKIQAAK